MREIRTSDTALIERIKAALQGRAGLDDPPRHARVRGSHLAI